jgi:sugar phosphate permease
MTLYIRWKLKETSAFNDLKETRMRLASRKKELLTAKEREILTPPIKLLLKGSNLSKLILTTTLCLSAIVGYWAAISWMPAWINQITGTEAVAERSNAMFWMSVGGIVVCFLCPWLTKALGRKSVFILGFVGSFISVVGMFLGITSYGPALLAAAFAVGVFSCIPFIVVCFYIPELFATHVLGTAAGISWSLGRIGAAVAGLATGPIIAAFGGSYAYAASTIALIYVVGLIAALFVKDPPGADEELHQELRAFSRAR